MNLTIDENARFWMQQCQRFDLIRDILEKVGANRELLEALEQAHVDNDRWMSIELAHELSVSDGADRLQKSITPVELANKSIQRAMLRELQLKVAEARDPDRTLDRRLHNLLPTYRRSNKIPHYTSSNKDVDKLMTELLPGFWDLSGDCESMGQACLGPAYEGPYLPLQEAAWPKAIFEDGFQAYYDPDGEGAHRECLARLHCILQALIARRGSGLNS